MTSNERGGKITWSKNDSQYSEEGDNDSQRREKDLCDSGKACDTHSARSYTLALDESQPLDTLV